MEEILTSWEDFARRFWQGPLPGSVRLRNDAELMIRSIVADMETSQNLKQQQEKSEGSAVGDPSGMNAAAMGHALARVEDGFDVARMVAEFRALRATIGRLWWKSVPAPHPEQLDDMERFNEALDQLVAASVQAFTEKLDRNRRLFLGILSHDMRQPLQSMRMFTHLLTDPKLPPETSSSLLDSMENCCEAMARILSDLLDYAATQLGSALHIQPEPANLGEICRGMVVQMEAITPGTTFHLETSGDLNGEWDSGRLGQLVSNLLSNAVQHGDEGRAVTIRATGADGEVALEVHNFSPPIPEEAIRRLFDPMVSATAEVRQRRHGSMGLGLYICRQIVLAHGGEVRVESLAENGTVFTVRLPRKATGSCPPAG
jgi:signal transduction histidine kinase